MHFDKTWLCRNARSPFYNVGCEARFTGLQRTMPRCTHDLEWVTWETRHCLVEHFSHFFPSHVPCQGGRGVQSQCIILNREARLAPPASVHCAMCNVHCALCTVQCARMEGLKARRSDNPSIIDSAVKVGTVVVAAEFLLVGLEIFLIGHSLGDGGLLHGWWTVSPQQRMCLHIEQGYQTQR